MCCVTIGAFVSGVKAHKCMVYMYGSGAVVARWRHALQSSCVRSVRCNFMLYDITLCYAGAFAVCGVTLCCMT
jgi:hypothetical protein